MPISAAHLRKLADEVEAEEEAERRKLVEADTAEERKAITDRLDALEKRNAELEEELARRRDTGADDDGDIEHGDIEHASEEEPEKPKMRRGRKHGQVYQDRKGEAAYVYQGEDEPDLIPVTEEDVA